MAKWFDKTVDFLFKEERTITGPTFIKKFSEENKQISDLEELSNRLKNGKKRDAILRDIAYLKKGLNGEKNVYYELMNSFLPILCLHDVRLEHEGYTAQYDFIVISDKFICVLETKQLNGNIVINSDGSFVRLIQDQKGKEIKREGMYSPITQNERHLNILKKVLREKELMGETLYLSYVVIANPKSIIHKEKCPSEIDKKIIRYDQLIDSLRCKQEKSSYHKLEKYLFEIAYWLRNNDRKINYDYYSRYNLSNEDFIRLEKFHIKENMEGEATLSSIDATQPRVQECKTKNGKKFIKITGNNQQAESVRQRYLDLGIKVGAIHKDRYHEGEYFFYINEEIYTSYDNTNEEIACAKEDNKVSIKKDRENLIKELREFRLNKSREENIAAYFIFNNEEMEDLISAYPISEEELFKVRGFGKKKVEKYGKDILRIFSNKQ